MKRTPFDQKYYDETLPRWKHFTGFDSAANFMGEAPTGYVIASRNRDSSILEESNWDAILKKLGGIGEHVRIVTHGHWACGWIEYILVSEDAPDELLSQCVEILKGLSDYLVLNEDDYNERQLTAVETHWQELSLRERVDMCREHEVSIFASRHPYPPDSVYDELRNYIG